MKGTWAAFDEYKKHPELYGYGYINAIPAQHCALIEMYRAYNNSDWVWAPYYSVHKQLAGLIDIATYFDDKEICDKADYSVFKDALEANPTTPLMDPDNPIRYWAVLKIN